MRKKIGIMLLAGVLAFQWNVPVLAKSVKNPNASSKTEVKKVYPTSQYCSGTILEIQKMKKRGTTKISIESEQYGVLVLNISKDTIWVDAKTCKAGSSARLKTGETLHIFHSTAMTRSLPPQTAAFAIIRNVPQDAMCPQYMTVDEVNTNKDGSLQIITDDREKIVILNKDTPLIPYRTKNIVKLDSIKKGTRLMVWYSIVFESYPVQIYPEQVMIVPEKDKKK